MLESIAINELPSGTQRAYESELNRIQSLDTGTTLFINDTDPETYAGKFLAISQTGNPLFLLRPDQDRTVIPDAPLGAHCGCIMIQTGGTGGKVKFAIHTPETLTNAALALQSFLGLKPLNSVCTLPLYHVSGLMQLIRAVVTGGSIQFQHWKALQPPEPGKWLLSLVPTQLQQLVKEPEKLRHFEAILVGGARCRNEILDTACKLGIPIIPVYGMTETAAVVAAQKPPLSHPLELSDLPHSAITIKEEQIHVRTSSLFKGYFPAIPQTQEVFATGDNGKCNANGTVTILGRMDRFIMTGGEKVDPQLVADAITQTGLAERNLVTGVDDPYWGEIVCAFVTGNVVVEELQNRLKETLPASMRPKKIVPVDALPINDKGKPDRTLIERLAHSAPS